MARKKSDAVITDPVPEQPSPIRVELLTVEAHPILGRIERWRMSDGSIQRVEENLVD